MNKDLLPVPKVWASTVGSLIGAITVATLVRFGWTDAQAFAIAPTVVTAAMVIGPTLITFLFGYAVTDGEREALKTARQEATIGNDDARAVIEYLQAARNAQR